MAAAAAPIGAATTCTAAAAPTAPYGDGALSTEAPGAEPPDSFLYNPLDPAPTLRRRPLLLSERDSRAALSIRRAVEHRADVLVYSTEPLSEDLEVTGPIKLTLYASSSAPDTDFTAKLVDVEPVRLCAQPDRRNHPRALARIAVAAGAAQARASL